MHLGQHIITGETAAFYWMTNKDVVLQETMIFASLKINHATTGTVSTRIYT